MSNFKELLSDVLIEQKKTFQDLEDAGVVSKRTFYQYNNFTPFLPTVIKISNYLKVSIDYLFGIVSYNSFKKYNERQKDFYKKLNSLLKERNISQSKLSKDLSFGRSNFTYWKKGALPKLSTLIELANYFGCRIDDFLCME